MEKKLEYSFKNIFEGIEGGYIAIWAKEVGARFFPVQDWEAAERYMQQLAKIANAYFCPAVLKHRPSAGRRGSADEVSYVTFFNLDWDIKVQEANVHAKNERLPGSLEEILAVVKQAGLPEPTVIINSGNGFYGRFHLNTPYHITNDADRDRVKKVSTDLHRAFIKAFAEAGWHMDQTADLVRVTRNPGTFNHKTDPAKLVTLVEYVEDRTYTMEQLEAFAQAAEPARKLRSRNVVARNENSSARESKLADFNAVAQGCGWVRSCLEDAKQLAEPDWFALGSVLAECENGAELFHEISAEDPRYKEEETQDKFDRSVGPVTCGRVRDDLMFEGCAMCAQNGHSAMTSPIQLGHRAPAVAGLLGRQVQIIGSREYADMETGRRIPYAEFSDKHMAFTQKSPHELMNREILTRKVDVVDYLPGRIERFVESVESRAFNIWRPSALLPASGNCKLILDHLKYLISEVQELEHLLDMLAHAVQKPGDKIRHVAMIRGHQGTGKTFLGNLLIMMFGEANTISVAGEDLLTRWTAGMGNKQVLLWEESGVGSQMEAYEKLKPWITDEMATVEQKHIPAYQARTPRIILGFTNQHVPIKIAPDDRRFMLINSSARPKPSAYYETLFSDGLAQAPAFLQYLLNRDISKFNPAAPPPVTKAKLQLIENSQSSLVRELRSMIEEGEEPFDRDLFTRDDLLRAARLRVGARANLSGAALVQAMDELGFVNLKQKRLAKSGPKPRLWAWRNAEKWQAANGGELSAEYRRARGLPFAS